MIIASLLALSLAPTVAEPKIVAASLFKNGYAVVVREVDIPESGEVLIMEPRQSVLGTLWITGAKGTAIKSVVNTILYEKIKVSQDSLSDILSLNIGKQIVITTTGQKNGEVEIFEGAVRSVTQFLVIFDQIDNSRIVFTKERVIQIASKTGDLVYQVESATPQRALRIQATGKGKAFVLSLERGLTWIPSYHVDISDAKHLKLTSKATVLNDLEGFEKIDIKLITGFPNIRFLSASDPLTNQQTVDSVVAGLMQMTSPTGDASIAFQNAGSQMAGISRFGLADSFASPLSTGEKLEDLFFTTIPNVSLRDGERGYFVQFQEEASYRHVYTLDLADTGWMNQRQGSGQLYEPYKPEVWHTLEFNNPSDNPLTTGTVTTFKNGEIIGQDLLEYTSPKSTGTIKITKALDVRAEVVEEEVERQLQAIPATKNSLAYDLVSAEGTIQIVNMKSEDVTLVITKSLAGEVTNASHDGAIKKNKTGLRSNNPSSEIKWSITVKRGKTMDLTYRYFVYAQSLLGGSPIRVDEINRAH